MLPGVGEAKDWGEAIIGYDIYGNKLSWWERGISAGSGLLPFVDGGSVRKGAKAILGGVGDVPPAGLAREPVARFAASNPSNTIPANAPSNPGARRSFWNDPIDVNGCRVYQRNDLFDPQAIDANGLTNLQRMQKGRPPVGFDGEPVNLHHTIQLEPGPIAEVGGRFHSENTKTLHGLVEDKGSFRYSPDGKTTEAEKAFRLWSYRYLQDRAKGIE